MPELKKKPRENHIDVAADAYKKMNDREKRAFFRTIGVIPFMHSHNGADIYPSKAGSLGKAIPAMSMLMSTTERCFDGLSNGSLDVGNSDLTTLLSDKAFFNNEDEDKGYLAAFLQHTHEHRSSLWKAMREADKRPQRKRPPRANANQPNQPAPKKATPRKKPQPAASAPVSPPETSQETTPAS